MRIDLIGGDDRMLRLASLCERNGHAVRTLGLKDGDDQACAATRGDVAVFPYPFAVRLGKVPCRTGLVLTAEDALERVGENTLLISGDGLETYLAKKTGHGWKHLLFSGDEPLLRSNAELSAEGALARAMQEPDFAIWQQRALVIGYGRLGRALARKLTALGAWVTVAARREESRLRARSDGMRSCAMEEMLDIAPSIRLVFNTVPSPVMNEALLRSFPSDARLWELASAPYGYDQQMALDCGLHSEILPSIPSRYAPSATADALYDALLRLMKGAFA